MLPGNFFDDIKVGDERVTPRVTVTEGHILAYAGVAGDFFLSISTRLTRARPNSAGGSLMV